VLWRAGLFRPAASTLREAQREQKKRRHHQFGALRDVINRLRDEGMNHPEQRSRECEFRGIRDTADAKGPRHYGKKQQRVEDVNRDVDQPVSPDVQLAERVVDRKRQADERPSGQWRSLLRA
jgi:hypothetical protein